MIWRLSRVGRRALIGASFLMGTLLSGTGAVADWVHWEVADGGNGHEYRAVGVGRGIGWDEADEAARTEGAYLATITSEAENRFVFGLVDPIIGENLETYWGQLDNSFGPFGPWLGGLQSPAGPEPDMGWEWVTGETFDYTAWYPGEPNNLGGEGSLHYFRNTPLWNDESGPQRRPIAYIVERTRAVPEPASFLLIGVGLLGVLGYRRSRADRS